MPKTCQRESGSLEPLRCVELLQVVLELVHLRPTPVDGGRGGLVIRLAGGDLLCSRENGTRDVRWKLVSEGDLRAAAEALFVRPRPGAREVKMRAHSIDARMHAFVQNARSNLRAGELARAIEKGDFSHANTLRRKIGTAARIPRDPYASKISAHMTVARGEQLLDQSQRCIEPSEDEVILDIRIRVVQRDPEAAHLVFSHVALTPSGIRVRRLSEPLG